MAADGMQYAGAVVLDCTWRKALASSGARECSTGAESHRSASGSLQEHSLPAKAKVSVVTQAHHGLFLPDRMSHAASCQGATLALLHAT